MSQPGFSKRECEWVGSVALVAIQGDDGGYFRGAELEVEERGILGDTSGVNRLGNGDHADLQVPAQDDLRDGSAVFFRYGREHGITQKRTGLHEGTPRGETDVAGAAVVVERLALQVRMKLDLVHGGDDFGLGQEFVEVRDHVVADADGFDAAGALEFFHGAPRGLMLSFDGPVEEIEIKVVESEFGHAVLEGCFDTIGTDVVVPDLGGDEDFTAGNTALAHCLADAALVVVEGRSVDVTVTEIEGGADSAGGVSIDRDLEYAQTEPGHEEAIVQFGGGFEAGSDRRKSAREGRVAHGMHHAQQARAVK